MLTGGISQALKSPRLSRLAAVVLLRQRRPVTEDNQCQWIAPVTLCRLATWRFFNDLNARVQKQLRYQMVVAKGGKSLATWPPGLAAPQLGRSPSGPGSTQPQRCKGRQHSRSLALADCLPLQVIGWKPIHQTVTVPSFQSALLVCFVPGVPIRTGNGRSSNRLENQEIQSSFLTTPHTLPSAPPPQASASAVDMLAPSPPSSPGLPPS